MSGKTFNENQQRYSWFMVTYNKPEEFKTLLNGAKHWFWILHDKDDAEPHYHIYASWQGRKTPKQIKKEIQGTQNTLFKEIISTPHDLVTYVLHTNYPEKHQYEIDEITFDNDQKYWSRGENTEAKRDENEEFLNHLLNGTDRKTMARLYGRDYMKNYRAYEDFANMIHYIEEKTKEKNKENET